VVRVAVFGVSRVALARKACCLVRGLVQTTGLILRGQYSKAFGKRVCEEHGMGSEGVENVDFDPRGQPQSEQRGRRRRVGVWKQVVLNDEPRVESDDGVEHVFRRE